jgi:hypothetical protein
VSQRAPATPASNTVPPNRPNAAASSAGPVCGSVPPVPDDADVEDEEEEDEDEEEEDEDEEEEALLTVSIRAGETAPLGVQVVVVPSALMVRVEGVSVTEPLWCGL